MVTPFPAQAGSDVGVTVRLFNSERTEAKNVKVEVFVGGEKLGEKVLDVPVSRPVIASGFSTWKAKPGRHEVRAVLTAGARSGSASSRSTSGRRTASARAASRRWSDAARSRSR